MILISGFIRNVPYSLEEAAWVDGCNRFTAFRVVVLPLLRPGLIAVGSFAFVHSWNHFLFALMFLSNQDKQTLPVGLNTLMSSDSVDWARSRPAASSPPYRSSSSSRSSRSG